ncbi:MAG: hypothetical protein GY804_05755 [Alphaproteobacteria bacterium]|nr:hypothetical protein [Alphaproteobacteria bacterium]
MRKLVTSSVLLATIFIGFNTFIGQANATDNDKSNPIAKEPSPLFSKIMENRKKQSTKKAPKQKQKSTKKGFSFTHKSKVAPKNVSGFKKPGKEKPIVSSLKITSLNKNNLKINNINRMYKRPARSIFGDPSDPNFDPASIPSTPIANGVPGNPLLYPTRIAVAFPKSLMFSKKDFDKISVAIDEGPFSRDPSKNRLERERSIFKNGRLFVSAIVYEGNDNWSAWINNKKIMPSFDDPIVKVISINHEVVELFIKGDTVSNDRRVRLRANQTYVPTKAKIYEGINN